MHGRDRVGPDAARSASSRRIAIAEALYVGLVTDTGKFMYENTGTRAHVMAAELIEAGVDVHDIYRRLYEGMPVRQARAAGARRSTDVERYDDGRLTLTRLTRDDFARDRRRGELLRGRHRPPALGRGHGGRGARARPARRRRPRAGARSRCAPPTAASTSRRIARAQRRRRPPPGGRLLDRRCRGPSSSRSCATQVAAQLVALAAARRRRPSTGSILVDKPAGKTSHDVVARVRRRARAQAQGRPRRHARPVRDRAAARARRPRDARAALPDGAAEDLRGRRAARRDLDHRRSGGRDRRDRARARPSRCAADRDRSRQRPPAYSAVTVGGERAYERARRGRGGRARPSARSRSRASSSCGATGDRAQRSRSSARRAPTCARSSPTSATPTAWSCGAPAIGPFDVEDADPERIVPLDEALALPAGASRSTGDDARRAAHGVAVAGDAADGADRAPARRRRPDRASPSRATDGVLKPVVGFRG